MLVQLKKILAILIPVVCMQVIDTLAALIDTVMLGHYSAVAVGMAMLAMTIWWLPMTVIMGFAFMSSALIGQAKGANNPHMTVRVTQATTMIITVLGGGAFIFLWHTAFFLELLDYDPYTIDMISAYVDGRLIGVLFMLAVPYQMFLVHYGVGRMAFIIKVLSLPLNIFLNWVFIYGNLGFSHMGIYGSGLATGVSQLVVTIILMVYATVHARNNDIYLWRNFRLFDRKTQGHIVSLGTFLTLVFIAEMVLFTNLSMYVGYYNAIVIGAWGLLMNFWMLAFAVQEGIGEACKAYMAQLAGGRNTNDIYQGLRIFLGIVLGVAILVAGISVGFGETIFTLMVTQADTHTPAIITQSLHSLPYLILAFFIQSFMHLNYSLLTALNDTRFMAIVMVVLYGVMGAIVSYLFVFYTNYGLNGILLTLSLLPLFALIISIIRLRNILHSPYIFDKIKTE